jgi:hypothetical protein
MYSVKDVEAAAGLRRRRIKNWRGEDPAKEKIMDGQKQKISEKLLTVTPPPPPRNTVPVHYPVDLCLPRYFYTASYFSCFNYT